MASSAVTRKNTFENDNTLQSKATGGMELMKYDVSHQGKSKLPPIANPTSNSGPMSFDDACKLEEMSGPYYTLPASGALMKYGLPPARLLKPYQDTQSGEMETWPAHATDSNMGATSIAITKNKRLTVLQRGQIKVPKPRFLEQLESYLEQELQTLGVVEITPSELRLQAHREVFEYLIEDFKTYKPLLARIKNEYEMVLAHYREQLRQLDPLKAMLITVSEQCDQKIMEIRNTEKDELTTLQNDNKKLYLRIDELKNEQVALQAQVEKLQEELAAEYLRYRDECDARKMLVADINELRYQQEDFMMNKQGLDELEEESVDPVTLSIALKKAREDEAAATRRLNEMIANYGDVIPRRDYEALLKDKEQLDEQMETWESDFNKLKAEHSVLLSEHKEVLQQRDELYMETENLRGNATPRPDWGKCADYIAGGNVRWIELSEGRTSDELVDVLLSEIQGGDQSVQGVAEFFTGLGNGEDVAAFLRYEGQVRNRRLGKRDTALLIKDIWREKAAADAERNDGTREAMDEFIRKYLERRFGLETMVIEWAYNLLDASERFSHDERIGMFNQIINGQADEELYHSQLQLIAQFLNHLTKIDMEKGNSGDLSKTDFVDALQEFFPDRDAELIQSLLHAAETELDVKEVDMLAYQNLFMEDDEGKTGPFLEEMIRQHTLERLKYVSEIQAELDEDAVVSVDDLKKAITIADPEIETPDMDKYLMWVFNVKSVDELKSAEPIELEAINMRLSYGNIKRIGPR